MAAPAAAPAAAQQPAPSGSPGPREQLLQELRDENDWKNGLALWVFPDSWVAAMPRVVRSWLRCYLLCMLLYVATGGAWAWYIYGVFRKQLFHGAHTPAASDMLEQIKVPLSSLGPVLLSSVELAVGNDMQHASCLQISGDR